MGGRPLLEGGVEGGAVAFARSRDRALLVLEGLAPKNLRMSCPRDAAS